jgi:hypothetical protein
MPPTERRIPLRLFFYEDSPGVWVAQAVEYDLNAPGRSMAHALEAFALSMLGQVLVDLKAGREPFSALGPPPPEALEGFDRGWQVDVPRNLEIPQDGLPPPWVIKAELTESRVYSA